MLFLDNFDSPSPYHTLSHIPEPPKVRHTSLTVPIFSRPSTKKRTKAPCTNSLSIVRGGFCPGVLSGGLLSGRFHLGWFLSVPILSEYMLHQKVKHPFKFTFFFV